MSEILNGMDFLSDSICLAEAYTYYTYDNLTDTTGETSYTGYTGTCVIPYKASNEEFDVDLLDDTSCLVVTGITMSAWTIDYLNALVTTGYTGYTSDGITDNELRIIYNTLEDTYYKFDQIESSNQCSGSTDEKWAIVDYTTNLLWSPTGDTNYYYDETDSCGVKTCKKIVIVKNINPFSSTYNQLRYLERPLIQLIAPRIETSIVTLTIPPTGATFVGNILSNGNGTISSKGFCYGIYSNPTIEDLNMSGGTGTSFTGHSVTNLILNETYYVRAYAIYSNNNIECSSESVEYGNELSFITIIDLSTVITSNPTDITSSSATSGGEVLNNGGSAILGKGICWSTSPNPLIPPASTTDEGAGGGSFTSYLTDLYPGTTYYIKAYAINSQGTSYGAQEIFTTLAITPTLTTSAISLITTVNATSGGNITSDGGSLIASKGICWSTSQNPTTGDTKTSNGTGSGTFVSSITGLTANTLYYVRAYATNSAGTGYGSQVSFTTAAVPALATLTTISASTITTTSAISGGDILSDGGASVKFKGVCWGTTENPNIIINSKTSNGTGTGVFTSNITGLNLETLYYIRAYATNSVGTAYGSQVSFTTIGIVVVAPTVSTNSITTITTTGGTSGGVISSDGGGSITYKGVCWSTSQNPTTGDTKTSNGTGTSSFISTITGLTANTLYYVRAYATNSADTSYGSQVSFTTTAIGVPTLTTTSATSITTTSATSGGNITSDGGASITAKGVCWSILQTPTTGNTKTSNGTGTGVFSSSMSGLASNTVYYVRAYATNSAGTSYGNQVSFTTAQPAARTKLDWYGSGTPKAAAYADAVSHGWSIQPGSAYLDANSYAYTTPTGDVKYTPYSYYLYTSGTSWDDPNCLYIYIDGAGGWG